MIFTGEDGLELSVITNKRNICFDLLKANSGGAWKWRFYFSEAEFRRLVKYLEIEAKKIWVNFEPKEANSWASDYDEYYDREYDNNGYLSIENSFTLYISGPDNTSSKLYQFNKRKLESFIFDCQKSTG